MGNLIIDILSQFNSNLIYSSFVLQFPCNVGGQNSETSALIQN